MEKNKAFSFFGQFVRDTITAMIIWPLVDLFFRVVIDKKEFVYSLSQHIYSPIMFGFFSALFTMILRKRSRKKDKSLTK